MCRPTGSSPRLPPPRECITLDERDDNEPPLLRNRSSDEERDGQGRTGKMKPAAGAIGVLAEIKRVKIPESAKRFFAVHPFLRTDQGGFRDAAIQPTTSNHTSPERAHP